MGEGSGQLLGQLDMQTAAVETGTAEGHAAEMCAHTLAQELQTAGYPVLVLSSVDS